MSILQNQRLDQKIKTSARSITYFKIRTGTDCHFFEKATSASRFKVSLKDIQSFHAKVFFFSSTGMPTAFYSSKV